MTPVIVLFEDQSVGGQPRNFGPGNLLCACIADLRGVSAWDVLPTVNIVPCKGDTKLIARCQDYEHRHSGRRQAILDADMIHRSLQVPSGSNCATLKPAWAKKCPLWVTGEVVLLDRNTETLVKLVASLLGTQPPTKDPAKRDTLLNRLAFGDYAAKRAELLVRSPSFNLAVVRVGALS